SESVDLDQATAFLPRLRGYRMFEEGRHELGMIGQGLAGLRAKQVMSQAKELFYAEFPAEGAGHGKPLDQVRATPLASLPAPNDRIILRGLRILLPDGYRDINWTFLRPNVRTEAVQKDMLQIEVPLSKSSSGIAIGRLTNKPDGWDYDAVLAEIARAAFEGAPVAHYIMGWFFSEGQYHPDESIRPDAGRAYASFVKAAVLGCPDALSPMAELLMRPMALERVGRAEGDAARFLTRLMRRARKVRRPHQDPTPIGLLLDFLEDAMMEGDVGVRRLAAGQLGSVVSNVVPVNSEHASLRAGKIAETVARGLSDIDRGVRINTADQLAPAVHGLRASLYWSRAGQDGHEKRVQEILERADAVLDSPDMGMQIAVARQLPALAERLRGSVHDVRVRGLVEKTLATLETRFLRPAEGDAYPELTAKVASYDGTRWDGSDWIDDLRTPWKAQALLMQQLGTLASLGPEYFKRVPSQATRILQLAGSSVAHRHPFVRNFAVKQLPALAKGLGAEHSEEIWRMLEIALSDEHPSVRLSAERRLGDLARGLRPVYIARIVSRIEAAARSLDRARRVVAAQQLAVVASRLRSIPDLKRDEYKNETKRVWAVARRLLRSRHDEIRAHALGQLGGLAENLPPGYSRRILRKLRDGLSDPSPSVRAAAAEQLDVLAMNKRYQRPLAAESLWSAAERAFDDDDESVQEVAFSRLAGLAEGLGPDYADRILRRAASGLAGPHRMVLLRQLGGIAHG
ncbi:MAG TPA: HEAT repeat domain-containing protein, partial [Planctomycetota bacterium]|nr:HEAT repeat domain-containing protein [Planctomycetota bacterium]